MEVEDRPTKPPGHHRRELRPVDANQAEVQVADQDREKATRTAEIEKETALAVATRQQQIAVAAKETERVGTSLYTYASLPFEIASVLLLVAIIGSVMLARTLKQEAAVDDVDPEVLNEIGAASSNADES